MIAKRFTQLQPIPFCPYLICEGAQRTWQLCSEAHNRKYSASACCVLHTVRGPGRWHITALVQWQAGLQCAETDGQPGPCSFARHGLAERRLVWPPNTTHLCHQLSFRTVTAALQLTSEKICFYFYCYGLSLSLAASSEQHENRRSKTARRTKARDRNDARESEPGRRPSFAKLIIEWWRAELLAYQGVRSSSPVHAFKTI